MQNTQSYWFQPNNFIQGNEHFFNLFWLLVLASSLILLGLGLRDPWPADEPRFAQIAKEMVESGQWFFPTRGGELYPDKPPIFMWTIAFFYWLTGSIKVAFLLPSALSSIATVLLVYDLGRRLWSDQIGWYAGVLLLLSIQFTLQAKTAQIDALVCFWITLGCYGLLRFLLLGGLWRWYYFAWFFMGIGVITKGVGFLPLLMLVPYAFLRIFKKQDANNTMGEISGGWRWLAGPLVMLAAISLWFVPMLLLVEHSQNPLYEIYRDNILFKQTITRYANSWHHFKPFWYYLVSVIPLFWLPLSLMLPWLLKHWKLALRNGDRRVVLPLVWVLLVILFFSLSPGKRGVYIFPALPMLALITAPYLLQIIRHPWLSRIIWLVVLTVSLVSLALGVSGAMGLDFAIKLSLKQQIEPWGFFSSIGLVGCAICLFTYTRNQFVSWILFIPLLWVFYSTWGYKLMNPIRAPHSIFAEINKVIPQESEIALIALKEQFLLFSPYKTTHFGYHTATDEQAKAAWLWQQQGGNRFILVDRELALSCFDVNKVIPVGKAHRVDWGLLSTDSLMPTCAEPEFQITEYHYQPIID